MQKCNITINIIVIIIIGILISGINSLYIDSNNKNLNNNLNKTLDGSFNIFLNNNLNKTLDYSFNKYLNKSIDSLNNNLDNKLVSIRIRIENNINFYKNFLFVFDGIDYVFGKNVISPPNKYYYSKEVLELIENILLK